LTSAFPPPKGKCEAIFSLALIPLEGAGGGTLILARLAWVAWEAGWNKNISFSLDVVAVVVVLAATLDPTEL